MYQDEQEVKVPTLFLSKAFTCRLICQSTVLLREIKLFSMINDEKVLYMCFIVCGKSYFMHLFNDFLKNQQGECSLIIVPDVTMGI